MLCSVQLIPHGVIVTPDAEPSRKVWQPLIWIFLALALAIAVRFSSGSLFLTILRRTSVLPGNSWVPFTALVEALPYGCLVLFSIWFILKKKVIDINLLGLGRPSFSTNGLIGVRVASLLVLTRLLIFVFPGDPSRALPQQPSFWHEAMLDNPLLLLFWFGQMSLLGPIAEEIFFRGCLYTSLKFVTSKRTAIGVSTAVWVLTHKLTSFPQAVVLIILGLIFVALYESRKSLIPPIIAHVAESFSWTLLLWYGWFSNQGIINLPTKMLGLSLGILLLLLFWILGLIQHRTRGGLAKPSSTTP